MSEVKCRLGAEVQMFNTPLVGMIDTDTNCIIIRQPKAGFDAPEITIDDLIGDFEKTIKDVGLPTLDLKNKLPKEITGNVNVAVNEIYLKIVTGNGDETGKSCEFAIWLSMSTTEALKELFPAFTITKGYLKLWSTNDPDILEEMQISQIEKMFDKAKAKLGSEPSAENASNPPKKTKAK